MNESLNESECIQACMRTHSDKTLCAQFLSRMKQYIHIHIPHNNNNNNENNSQQPANQQATINMVQIDRSDLRRRSMHSHAIACVCGGGGIWINDS